MDLKKIRGLILFTIFMLVAIWNYKVVWQAFNFLFHVIFPFILGGAIAFILNVPMSFIERKLFQKMRRGARQCSFVLTVLSVIGVLVLVCYIVIPELGNTVLHLSENMQKFLPKIQEWTGITIDWEKAFAEGIQFLKEGAGGIFDSTYQAAKSIVSGVVTFVVAFVFSCYILLQKEKLGVQVRKLMYAFLPEDWTEILLAFSSLTSETFSNFFTGQFLEALILGGMFFVTLLLLRLPYALLISVVIIVTALIPVVGAFVGCAVGTLLIFTVNPGKALLFILVFLVLQQVEGNFIYPHVVGNSVGLPSIWVLFSVGVGAGLWGIVGIVVFIPISSVIYTMLKGIVHRRLKDRGITVE